MTKTDVSQLVDGLFRAHCKANGREYTYKEIAESLEGTIDPSHISKLRHGQIKNPSRETLLALCRFFKVPASYFFPELEPMNEPLPDADVIVHRAHVSPSVKKKLQDLIDALEEE